MQLRKLLELTSDVNVNGVQQVPLETAVFTANQHASDFAKWAYVKRWVVTGGIGSQLTWRNEVTEERLLTNELIERYNEKQ